MNLEIHDRIALMGICLLHEVDGAGEDRFLRILHGDGERAAILVCMSVGRNALDGCRSLRECCAGGRGTDNGRAGAVIGRSRSCVIDNGRALAPKIVRRHILRTNDDGLCGVLYSHLELAERTCGLACTTDSRRSDREGAPRSR